MKRLMKIFFLLFLSYQVFPESDYQRKNEIKTPVLQDILFNNSSGLFLSYKMWESYLSREKQINENISSLKNSIFPYITSDFVGTRDTIMINDTPEINALSVWTGFAVATVVSLVFDVEILYEDQYLDGIYQFDPERY